MYRSWEIHFKRPGVCFVKSQNLSTNVEFTKYCTWIDINHLFFGMWYEIVSIIAIVQMRKWRVEQLTPTCNASVHSRERQIHTFWHPLNHFHWCIVTSSHMHRLLSLGASAKMSITIIPSEPDVDYMYVLGNKTPLV